MSEWEQIPTTSVGANVSVEAPVLPTEPTGVISPLPAEEFNPPDAQPAPAANEPDRAISAPPSREPQTVPTNVKGFEDFNPPDQAPKTQEVFDGVSHLDPKRAGDVIDLSRKLGEPHEFVDENLEKLKKADQAPPPQFFKDLEKNAPATSKWLSDPANMAKAHDDLPNLRDHEELFKNTIEAHSWLDAMEGGLQHSVLGVALQTLMDEAGLSPQDKSLAPKIVMPRDAGTVDKLLFSAGGILGDAPFFAIAPSGPLAAIAGFALQGGAKKLVEDQYRNGNIQGARDLVDRTLGVAGATLKGGAVGAAVSLAGAAGSAAFPAGAQWSNGLINEVAKFTAEAAAVPTASKFVEEGKLEAPTWDEFIHSLLLIGALHVGGAAAGSFFRQALKERGAPEPRPTKDVTPETPKALPTISDAQVDDVRAGNPPTEPPPAPTEPSPFPDLKTQSAGEFLDKLDELSQASKLKTVNPDAYHDYLRTVTKDTPFEFTYVDAKELEDYADKNGIDLPKTLMQMGVDEPIEQLKSQGANVKIRTADFVFTLGDTPHRNGLKPDIKFGTGAGPGHLSEKELKVRKEEWADKTKKVEEAAKNGNAVQKAYDQIQSDVALKVGNLGRYPQEYAEKMGHLFASRAIRRAQQLGGVDPMELYKNDPELQVVDGGDAKTFEQPVIDASDKFNDWEVLNDKGESSGVYKTKEEATKRGQVFEKYGRTYTVRPVKKGTAPEGATFKQEGKGDGIQPSPVGYYSDVEKQVSEMEFKSDRLPAVEVAGKIGKLKGLKKEELEHIGLFDWLKVREAEAGQKSYRVWNATDNIALSAAHTKEFAEGELKYHQDSPALANNGKKVELREQVADGKVTKAEVMDFIKKGGLKVTVTVQSKDYQDTHNVERPLSPLGRIIQDLNKEIAAKEESAKKTKSKKKGALPQPHDVDFPDPEWEEPDESYQEDQAQYYADELYLGDDNWVEEKTKEFDEEHEGEFEIEGHFVVHDKGKNKRSKVFETKELAEKWAKKNVKRKWYDYNTRKWGTLPGEYEIESQKLVDHAARKVELDKYLGELALEEGRRAYRDGDNSDDGTHRSTDDATDAEIYKHGGDSHWQLQAKSGETWHHIDLDGSNFNEAKVQAINHLIRWGIVEGDISSLVDPEDITWDVSNSEVSSWSHPAKKRAEKLLKEKESGRALRARAKARILEKDGDASPNKDTINYVAKELAQEEALAYYRDPNRGSNKLEIKSGHEYLDATIRGNNKKGYELEFEKLGKKQKRKLKAETLEEAQAESLATFKRLGMTSDTELVSQAGVPEGFVLHRAKEGEFKNPDWDTYPDERPNLDEIIEEGVFVVTDEAGKVVQYGNDREDALDGIGEEERAVPHRNPHNLPDGYALEKVDDGTYAVKDASGKVIQSGKSSMDALRSRDPLPESNDPYRPVRRGSWESHVLYIPTNPHEKLIELVINVPGVGYTSNHFPQVKDYLMHLMLSIRKDILGRKIMNGEENQNDLHQATRKFGTKGPELEAERQQLEGSLAEEETTRQKIRDEANELAGEDGWNFVQGYRMGQQITKDFPGLEAIRERFIESGLRTRRLKARLGDLHRAAPKAPFSKTEAWLKLGMKQQIWAAVKFGQEGFSWFPSLIHLARWGTPQIGWERITGSRFVLEPSDFKATENDFTLVKRESQNDWIATVKEPRKFGFATQKIFSLSGAFSEAEAKLHMLGELNETIESRQRGDLDKEFESRAEAEHAIKTSRNGDFLDHSHLFNVKEVPATGFKINFGGSNLGPEEFYDLDPKLTPEEQRAAESEKAKARREHVSKKGDVVKTRKEVIDYVLEHFRDGFSTEAQKFKIADHIWNDMQKQEWGELKPSHYELYVGAEPPLKEHGEHLARKGGYEMEYDVMIPKVVKEIFKDIGFPNVQIEDIQFDKNPHHNAKGVIFTPEMIARIKKGFTLFQGNKDEPRGSSTFLPKSTIMRIFSGADKSTPFHEASHIWLEEIRRDMEFLAQKDPATLTDEQKQYMKDGEEILRFIGANSWDDIKEEHHEKWARGFEKRVWEGIKAASEALRRMFDRFRDWLRDVYKDADALDVELTPEIRDVYDRLILSQEEIALASERAGLGMKVEGLPPEVEMKLTELEARARSQAEDLLLREQMKDTKVAHKELYDKRRAEAVERATVAVEQMPLYAAMTDIAASRKSAADVANRFLEDRVTDDVAAKFEATAEVHDFTSGEEMAQAFIQDDELGGYQQAIDALVAQDMKPFADLKDSDEIKVDAMKFIHDERMTELLALEKQIFQGLVHDAAIGAEVTKRNRQEAKVAAMAVKEKATEILSKKPIRDSANASIYITQERQAAVRVSKAAAKGDWQEAAFAKEQQMLNHALVAEAMRNRELGEKAVKYLRRFEKRGRDLVGMPYGFVRQVDGLLAQFGLIEPREEYTDTLQSIAKDLESKAEDPGEIANQTGLVQGAQGWAPESLSQFVARVNDSYYGLSIPDHVLHGSKSDFKDMTLKELLDLKTAVQAVHEIGKKYNRFLGEFKEMDTRQAAEGFAFIVRQNVGAPYAEKLQIGSAHSSELMEKVAATLDLPTGVAPLMVNMLTLCEYLDNKEAGGPAKEYIYRPMKQAEDRKLKRLEKAHEAMDTILSRYYTPKELAAYKDTRVRVPELGGRVLTKEQILSLALNWGNEINRDRLVRGYKVSPDQFEAVLFRELSKRDFDFAQDVWNYIQTFWPESVALEQKINGTTPVPVKPSPLITPWGQYPGGYYPLAYDYEKSAQGLINQEQKHELYKMTQGGARAQTEQGHLITRASNVTLPVRLSLSVLFNHIENVVHDLEFRPAIIDLQRFLKKSNVRQALEHAIDVKGYKMVSDWLKSVASDQGEYLSWAEKKLQWFRFANTFSQLAWKMKNLPIDLVGNVINVTHEMVSRTDRPSIADFIQNPKAMNALANAKSIRMKRRAELRDRDLMDLAKKWGNKDSAFKTYAYFFQSLADELVSVPLWNAVYKANLDKHGEKMAIDLADEAVTRTAGSGTRLDQVAVQQGNEYRKFSTMFFNWASMMFNRVWLEGKFAGLEYSKGNYIQALLIMARATIFLWFLPALNEIVQREALRNSGDRDDEEKRARRAVTRFLSQPLGYVWLARDIGGWGVDRFAGNKTASLHLTPVEQGLETLLKPFLDAPGIALSEDKQFDGKYWESAFRSASLLLGYPQTMNDLTFNAIDALEDGELRWRDAIQRRTKK